MRFKLYQKGTDSFGPFWWFWFGRGGLVINFDTSAIDLRFGLSVGWGDCKCIAFTIFNLDICYFPNVGWDE